MLRLITLVATAGVAWSHVASAQTIPTDQEMAAQKAKLQQMERTRLAEDIRQQQVALAAMDAQIANDAAVAAKARAGEGAKAEPGAVDQAKDVSTTRAQDQKDAINQFAGLEFGVGLSLTLDRGGRDRIGEARLDEAGIVRVVDRNNSPARVMLESHYFFTPCGRVLGVRNDCSEGTLSSASWGIGPFVALQPGGEKNIIDAVGLGLMVGFRRNPTSGESFNFGIGVVLDPNTKVLGAGVRENERLPAGETQVRLEETTQTGILFLTSFSF